MSKYTNRRGFKTSKARTVLTIVSMLNCGQTVLAANLAASKGFKFTYDGESVTVVRNGGVILHAYDDWWTSSVGHLAGTRRYFKTA
jgi:hypothetical protein